jgi:hypothetical protein
MLRTDLWVAAFVRRHNDLGHVCVISRKGDPIAGQIFIEVDHLNGTVSLYTPAPAAFREDSEDRLFQARFEHAESGKVLERIAQEQKFDPDLWVIALEMRKGELGITEVPASR